VTAEKTAEPRPDHPPLQSVLRANEQVAKDGIIYDGLNLALAKGTGIATYTRILAEVARELGYDVGVVYEARFAIPEDPKLQDLLFVDQSRQRPRRRPLVKRLREALAKHFDGYAGVKPVPLNLGAAVDIRQFTEWLPDQHRAFAAKDVFKDASRLFRNTGRMLDLSFEPSPNIFHCTYALPLRAKNACNIYTIHDLVPLRLPHATTDDKRAIYDLLKGVAAQAEHIVTVSEASKRDIVELLGVPENRITNTYQSVTFPDEFRTRSEEAVANHLAGQYGLDTRGYLLFFGAIEPKKNVARLIDAYLSSGVSLPLVLVGGEGWQNEAELARLHSHAMLGFRGDRQPTIRQFDYVTRSNLANLIRGARAVVFPSLMEGFGLPVLEAMTLGTPVLTSSTGALAEIAADAALLVDPYNVDDIARGITTLANDTDLCGELSRRGLIQADKFSLARYRERVGALYTSLI
jgi:glycosyltransferase involved in cell wall biosynthesis